MTLECANGHERTYAYAATWAQPMQSEPLPDVRCCPVCGIDYPRDLAVAMVESRECDIVDRTDLPPSER